MKQFATKSLRLTLHPIIPCCLMLYCVAQSLFYFLDVRNAEKKKSHQF